MSRNGKIIVGMFSLVFVLLYNWTHTGGLLASYVRPEFVGYIAAAGIELSVVGLSLRIYELRTEQSDAKFHVATLAAVVIVSALANIAEGYAVKFGESLTSANIGRLDAVQAIVSLSATGLLSLVVFALAEVVGHDIGASDTQVVAQDLSIDLRGLQVPSTGETDEPNSVTGDDTGYNMIALKKTASIQSDIAENDESTTKASSEEPSAVLERDKVTTADIILEFYSRNPNATLTQAAQHVARATGTTYSRQAISAQLKRLEVAGLVERNGHVTVKAQS